VDHAQVRDPRAYLIRIVTRQALNRLRTLKRSREDYVGQWLPEPLLTSPDVAEEVELAESVSMAMLIVLEALGPAERAVFVLREVFGIPYGEIAQAIGKSAPTVRQIARRARERVAARRPRVQVSPSEHQAVVERFLVALRNGQLQELMELMAPDVVMTADGGGVVAAALAPVRGAERVASLLARANQVAAGFEATAVWLNGAPAGRMVIDGKPASVILTVDNNGRVSRICVVRNPPQADASGRTDGAVSVSPPLRARPAGPSADAERAARRPLCVPFATRRGSGPGSSLGPDIQGSHICAKGELLFVGGLE
jgi:RNA polymerase sigma-70 factor, ECF subfamily